MLGSRRSTQSSRKINRLPISRNTLFLTGDLGAAPPLPLTADNKQSPSFSELNTGWCILSLLSSLQSIEGSREKNFHSYFHTHVCLEDIIFPEFEFIKPELYHIPLKRYPIYLQSQSPQHILRNFVRVSLKPRNFWKPILLFQLLCLYRRKIKFSGLGFPERILNILREGLTNCELSLFFLMVFFSFGGINVMYCVL